MQRRVLNELRDYRTKRLNQTPTMTKGRRTSSTRQESVIETEAIQCRCNINKAKIKKKLRW